MVKNKYLKAVQQKLKSARKAEFPVKRQMHREAAILLRKTINGSASVKDKAWAWYELARVISWLGAPLSEVENAFLKAKSLLPKEPLFQERHERWQKDNYKEMPR